MAADTIVLNSIPYNDTHHNNGSMSEQVKQIAENHFNKRQYDFGPILQRKEMSRLENRMVKRHT